MIILYAGLGWSFDFAVLEYLAFLLPMPAVHMGKGRERAQPNSTLVRIYNFMLKRTILGSQVKL